MSERICTKCGRTILEGVSGNLCLKCKLDSSPESSVNSLHYDVKDMMEILGLESEEQVRRLSRAGKIPGRVPGITKHLFIKKIVDKWIEEGSPILRIPNSPIQEKARAMCKQGDHSWIKEEDYEGNSYSRECQVNTEGDKVKIGYLHKCYFCDYTEYHPFGS